MKRKVLLAGCLIIWLLVCCTLLSARIEVLMTAHVVTVPNSGLGAVSLPMEALSYDESGYHLFDLIEGSGWESGLRAREREEDLYSIEVELGVEEDESDDTHKVSAIPRYNTRLISFSSRFLRDGEKVEEITGNQFGNDMYLAIFPEMISEPTGLSASLQVEIRRDNILLLSDSAAPLPFLESRIRSTLYGSPELRPYISPEKAECMRVFSLSDLTRFSKALPYIFALFGLLLAPVVLWCGSCGLSRHRGSIGLLQTNLILTVLDGGCIPRLLDAIDLPSSLLPDRMIFDFAHYWDEFQLAFGTLRRLEDNGVAYQTCKAFDSAFCISVSILLIEGLLLLAVLTVEIVLLHKKSIRCKI